MLTSLLARNVPVAKNVSTDYYVVRNLSNELIAKWACNAHKIRQIRHLRGVIVARAKKNVQSVLSVSFYITKFKYHLCYYLNLFAILAKGTVR